MEELFDSAKNMSDVFLKVKFPGIYVEVKLQCIENFVAPSKIMCTIHVFEKTFAGKKLIRKIAHCMKKESHLQTFAECLHELKVTYGEKCQAVSDSD